MEEQKNGRTEEWKNGRMEELADSFDLAALKDNIAGFEAAKA
jgi:hypothetical protein